MNAELQDAIESVYEGWYSEGRIDWEDFLDRVESVSGQDLGADLLSSSIQEIKSYARKYGREIS